MLHIWLKPVIALAVSGLVGCLLYVYWSSWFFTSRRVQGTEVSERGAAALPGEDLAEPCCRSPQAWTGLRHHG